MAKTTEIIRALDEKLAIADFDDVSNNGLQVETRRPEIRRVCTGVDATLPFFEAAAAKGADLVVCHHGISWGDSLKRITGLNYRLVRSLLGKDVGLYACHLPLDAHAELGNNARIALALGLRDLRPFGFYHGRPIGFSGEFEKPVSRDALEALVAGKVNRDLKKAAFGKEEIRTVGVVSGGGDFALHEAIGKGLDAFLTGELGLAAYNEALQAGANLYAAGHYATERFGVKAVGAWLERTFGVEHAFIDFGLPC